jgi:hypothetical protein
MLNLKRKSKSDEPLKVKEETLRLSKSYTIAKSRIRHEIF